MKKLLKGASRIIAWVFSRLFALLLGTGKLIIGIAVSFVWYQAQKLIRVAIFVAIIFLMAQGVR